MTDTPFADVEVTDATHLPPRGRVPSPLERAATYAAIFNNAERGGRGWRYCVPVDGRVSGRGDSAHLLLNGCVVERDDAGVWAARVLPAEGGQR
jgi:hypothetical protein